MSPLSPDDLAGIAVPDPGALIALRQHAREISLFPRRQALSIQGGGYRSRFRGRGMEFDEARPYQPGDDVRAIDWRVTARTATTYTKVFREERERPVLIAVDLRSPMFFGSQRLKSLAACDVAALLAWAGLAAGDRVGGLVFGPGRQWDSRARRGRHGVLRLVQHLTEACQALYDATITGEGEGDDPALATILGDCRRVATPGAAVVVISDFHDLDDDCEKHLFELARHCDLTLCQVSDILEQDLPPPGLYNIRDGDAPRLLDSRRGKSRELFARQAHQRRAALAAVAARLAMPLLHFAAEQPVLPALRRAFAPRAGRRRS